MLAGIEVQSTYSSHWTQKSSVWKTPEMMGIYDEWQRFVAQSQQAYDDYRHYVGGNHRIEGQLAVRMAALQSAERIAHRAMLIRENQLMRTLNLPPKLVYEGIANSD